MRFTLAVLALLCTAPAVAAAEWQRYVDPVFHYSIDAPDDGFETVADPARNGLTLFERDGHGQIDVYAVDNTDGLTLGEIRDAISQADRIKRVTYSRAGRTWFVLSGYYRRQDETDLIFYAKFMFSPDRATFSGFEASYPVDDKRRYDPIIERMEDTLTAPRG